MPYAISVKVSSGRVQNAEKIACLMCNHVTCATSEAFLQLSLQKHAILTLQCTLLRHLARTCSWPKFCRHFRYLSFDSYIILAQTKFFVHQLLNSYWSIFVVVFCSRSMDWQRFSVILSIASGHTLCNVALISPQHLLRLIICFCGSLLNKRQHMFILVTVNYDVVTYSPSFFTTSPSHPRQMMYVVSPDGNWFNLEDIVDLCRR